ncbi:TPA: hypothetical protein EYP45_01545 [Candidatus Peregrinibacteria bacterium]|nr:hypothetical protein [Candidatus Peregrinibacteria bacterium]
MTIIHTNTEIKIIAYIQHIYEQCEISESKKKTPKEILEMSFTEKKNYISKILLQSTHPFIDHMANGLSIEPVTKIVGKTFYTHLHNLPIHTQLQLSAMLHFIMSFVINTWDNSLIHGKQLFRYIALPYINKQYDLHIQNSDIKGGNLTEKYMHLYAIAHDKIQNTKAREKMKIELSSLFYTAKYITTTSIFNINKTKNIENNILKYFTQILNIKNLENIIEIQNALDTQNMNNKKAYFSAQMAAEAEEATRGNIFDTSISQQISRKVKNKEIVFPFYDTI